MIAVWLFFKRIPWQAWAIAGLVALMVFLRSHWIGLGIERCERKQETAQAKADEEALKQEQEAPTVAQEARDAVEPAVTERVRIIREQIKSEPVGCNAVYDDSVLNAIREAKAATDIVRPSSNPKP